MTDSRSCPDLTTKGVGSRRLCDLTIRYVLVRGEKPEDWTQTGEILVLDKHGSKVSGGGSPFLCLSDLSVTRFIN